MIVTLLVAVLLVVVGCVALIALYVVPFVLSVDMAERRGLSTDRVGALALALTLISAGCAVKGIHSHLLLVPAVLLTWAGPAVLALLGPGQSGFGRQGAHEA